MKLSESGIQKVWQWSCNDIKGDLKDLEFKPEDFLLDDLEVEMVRLTHTRDFEALRNKSIQMRLDRLHQQYRMHLNQTEKK